jgi:hypothetical protein
MLATPGKTETVRCAIHGNNPFSSILAKSVTDVSHLLHTTTQAQKKTATTENYILNQAVFKLRSQLCLGNFITITFDDMPKNNYPVNNLYQE